MFWNHRVVRHKIPKEQIGMDGVEEYFAIHEVHYNSKRQVTGMTIKPVEIQGDCVEDLGWTLTRMMKCLENPVLDFDMKLVDYDMEEENETEG